MSRSNIKAMAAVQDKAAEPLERLTAILNLGSIGRKVVGTRLVGSGSQASADLYLDDGSSVYFEKFGDMGTPQRLAREVVACTGAQPTSGRGLKQVDAFEAMALVRKLAELVETSSHDDAAVDWGLSYLQAAQPWPLAMGDREERWMAFSHLKAHDPYGAAEEHRHKTGNPIPFAAATVVLLDTDGTRYVRTGWFQAFVRRQDQIMSPSMIDTRMLRVGWRQCNKQGRMFASRPSFAERISHKFYVVPPTWEASNTETGGAVVAHAA